MNNSVFILTCESLSTRSAGVALRYIELAHALAKHFPITLASTGLQSTSGGKSPWVQYPSGNSRRANLLSKYTIILVQAFSSKEIPRKITMQNNKYIVVDFYCPFWLENSVAIAARGGFELYQHRMDISIVRDQLQYGDYFLCASSRQRDMLIGLLTIMGRLTPAQIAQDPSLEQLIGVVPFGLPAEPFPVVGPTVHGLIPDSSLHDRVIVWGGGIHDWLDVETPIRAMSLLRDSHPEIKLLFATTVSHPEHEAKPNASRALSLASDAGLLGQTVFFLDGWTPYDQRANYLRGATAGIVCHAEHVETRFAFRTRVLDYLWASIPIITSEGDEFASVVRSHNLGIVVAPSDPAALASGLVELVQRVDSGESFADRISTIRPRYHWENVAAPLMHFCANPRKSVHLGDPVLLQSVSSVMNPHRELSRLFFRSISLIRTEPLHVVINKVIRTVKAAVARM